MNRCKCDWSAEHTPDEFKRITPITHKERAQIEEMFRTYLVVKIKDRRTKNFYCTGCGDSSDFIKPCGTPELDYDPYNDFTDYYSLKHGERAHCPFCGKSAEVIYARKMGMRCEKMWQQVQVVVFHSEADGWLSVQAVYAVKSYNGRKWDTGVEFFHKAQYLFRPGCALQRVNEYRVVKRKRRRCWNRTTTIYEPFKSGRNDYWTDQNSRGYNEIGLHDCLNKTEMKYSAADQFISEKEDNYGLIQYLGEYCHRQQLEMLTKLELDDILRELIYCHRSNPRLVNWKATDLPGFLRLDKWHSKLFMKLGHKTIQELEVVQILQQEGIGVQGEIEALEFLTGMRIETVRQLQEAAGGYPLVKVLRYLMKQENADAVQLWIDYIRMAKDLEYDLGEETVFSERFAGTP